jgi:hypothetical protein
VPASVTDRHSLARFSVESRVLSNQVVVPCISACCAGSRQGYGGGGAGLACRPGACHARGAWLVGGVCSTVCCWGHVQSSAGSFDLVHPTKHWIRTPSEFATMTVVCILFGVCILFMEQSRLRLGHAVVLGCVFCPAACHQMLRSC